MKTYRVDKQWLWGNKLMVSSAINPVRLDMQVNFELLDFEVDLFD
jgi:hypothetical protein